MQCGVVVVAAGQGKRLRQGQHKALVDLFGRPLFLWCVENFSKSNDIDEVIIVVHKDDITTFSDGLIGKQLSALGVCRVVEGGAERQDSVLAGLYALSPSVTKALVHDAARPFVSNRTIEQLVEALDDHPAAVPVVKVASTVKQVNERGSVEATIPRNALRLAQTPQAARKDLLIAALESAANKGEIVTDDVQAMELVGHEVVTIEDSTWNFKVTTPEDLQLARLVAREKLHLEDQK
ncbi:MAG: 2-C-methyl-D-erythritol 4-phosphate cytidylyltransferase [Planctomycetota bacterium]|jgi:2-C-methyl-D-erythritol 4-phosphate cytidylyltransferase